MSAYGGPSFYDAQYRIDDCFWEYDFSFVPATVPDGTNPTTYSEFVVYRSTDNGRNWEVVATHIAALDALRDDNRTRMPATGWTPLGMPVLVAQGKLVHAVWVEGGTPKHITSFDSGDTWRQLS